MVMLTIKKYGSVGEPLHLGFKAEAVHRYEHSVMFDISDCDDFTEAEKVFLNRRILVPMKMVKEQSRLKEVPQKQIAGFNREITGLSSHGRSDL